MRIEPETIDKVNSALDASQYLFEAKTDSRIYARRLDEKGDEVGHEIPIKLSRVSVLKIHKVSEEDCWVDLPSDTSTYRGHMSLNAAHSMLPKFEETLKKAIKDGEDGAYLPNYENKLNDALDDELDELELLEGGSSGAWS